MVEKLNKFRLTSLKTLVIMGGFVLEEKSFFKMLGLTLFSKLDCGSYIISIANTASKKNWSPDSFYEVSFS